jgi:endonuclease/exonuclease/phosphatase family metal-dependent hydrolase
MLIHQGKLILIRILLLINLFLICSIICAYIAPYISPAVFWPLAFFGLAYPVIIVANIIMSLVWLFIRPRYALFSAILVISGIIPLSHVYQMKFGKTDDPKKGFTIVSYNVDDFSGIKDGFRHHAIHEGIREEIFSFMCSQKPQIICMQDMQVKWADREKTLSKYMLDLGMKNIYINSFGGDTISSFNSTALLTNYPVIDSGELTDSYHLSFAIFNDLQIGRDTVRVYSVHLASIMLFGEKEMLTASGVAQSPKRGIPRQIIRIIRKLKTAFIRRASQVEMLDASILASPYPVIVCGDFNDTPLSYTIHTIRHGLKDSFTEKGRGFGRTYIGSNVPLRIDNVFADPSFNFTSHEVGNIDLSDHLPVVTTLWLNKKPASSPGK